MFRVLGKRKRKFHQSYFAVGNASPDLNRPTHPFFRSSVEKRPELEKNIHFAFGKNLNYFVKNADRNTKAEQLKLSSRLKAGLTCQTFILFGL